MWIRFNREDLAVIAHFLGVLIVGVALFMLVPLLTAFVMREWGPANDYALSMAICGVVGGALRLTHIRPHTITRQQSLAVVGLAWIVVALAGAIPLYLSGHWPTLLDALFESVAGFTTSGFSIVHDLDHLAYSHNMWRHLMLLIGGQGIIVVALAFAFVGRFGGTVSLYQAEGRGEHVLPNLRSTSRFIWFVTGTIVVIGTAVLFGVNLANGMGFLRGTLHAFWATIATYDTGGFAPQSMSALYYHSWGFELVTMFLMLIGMMNFAVQLHLLRGNWRELFKNIETRTLFVTIVFFATLTGLALASTPQFNGIEAIFRKGMYHVVSASSGAGHQTIYASQWGEVIPSAAFFSMLLIMGLGGSVSSTTGGIKAMRIGLVAKSILASVRSALAPESAVTVSHYHHLKDRVLTPGAASAAATVFILYILSYVLGTVAGVAYGYPLQSAMFESVAAASNAGMGIGVTSTSMPVGLKIVYMIQMWVGRLEFIALFALIAGVVASMAPRWRLQRQRRPRSSGSGHQGRMLNGQLDSVRRQRAAKK